jgi:hypothetical protein
MHRLTPFDDSHLLSDRGDGIANLVNGAQQFVFRHPQMPAPAENGRRIVHVDVASRPAALDRSSADHLSDPFCNNKVLQFTSASQASARSIVVFRLDPVEGLSA